MDFPEHFRNKISMRIRPFCKAAGFGTTLCYELIRSGKIESFTEGKARFIVLESYRVLIERQTAKPSPNLSPNPRAPSRIAAQPAAAYQQQVVNQPRRRGRPPGSKNRAREETPATPAARPR